MNDETQYVCEYQLYPDSEFSTYGSICNWTQCLENYVRHVSKYPTEAVRIRTVEMGKVLDHEFVPAGFEEKGL